MNAPDIAALLTRAGRDATIRKIRSLKLGGNNRSWQVLTSDNNYAVKQYFRHAEDQRDRLTAEFDFAFYASAIVPDSVPQPVIQDAMTGVAVYAFIPGEVLHPGQVGAAEVEAAAAFFRALNEPARRANARELPLASEACFSIDGHLALVRQRIKSLREILIAATDSAEASIFIDTLWQRWQLIEAEIRDVAGTIGIDASAELAPEQRCVSPSDFGFHNALRDATGKIRFLDFEYAGWDDPAKMVGDFFAQLSVPVPAQFFATFARATLYHFPNADALLARAALLRPVYQVKWCCIALNVLLPVHLARRRFANSELDEAALKSAQLAKAQSLFDSLVPISYDLH